MGSLQAIGCELVSSASTVGAQPPQAGRGRGAGGRGCCCSRIPQTVTECLFFLFLFEKFLLSKPATSDRLLASHTTQLSSQTRDLLGPCPSLPNSSQPVCTVSVGVYHPCVLPIRPYSLPVTSSVQVPLGATQTLFGRGGSC